MKSFAYRIALSCASVLLILLAPAPASAQSDGWHVDLAPLYFWAATTSGNLAINGTKNIPVYLDFADAASHLAGVFTFHGEVRHGRWGVLGDVNFMRLSTDVNYRTPILSLPIAGSLKLDQTIFNGKVMYEVKPGAGFFLVGGVRTMTMAPAVHFTGPSGGQLIDFDDSKTGPAGVVGFIYRPRLGDKVVLLTQADIGGGAMFTASALGGLEFLIKPWIGLTGGYNVLRIDTGSVPTSGTGPVDTVQYAVSLYGPVFSLTFHWNEK
jgi:hypothetical protein